MIFLNQRNDEVFREYKEWLPFIVDIYAPIRDSETGDFRFLPFPGSLMDQPYSTMEVLKEIQNTYREVCKEKQEQALQKAKAKK
jgi:hypothetical protein